MHIHLHIVYSCFSATIADLNSCDKDLMAYKAEDTTWLFTKKKFIESCVISFHAHHRKNYVSFGWYINPHFTEDKGKAYNIL